MFWKMFWKLSKQDSMIPLESYKKDLEENKTYILRYKMQFKVDALIIRKYIAKFHETNF